MLTVDARFSDTKGNGVGRWRVYNRCEDMQEALWRIGHLVPKCQVRIRAGREVVAGPMRAEEFGV